jgi:secreted PhoX family phosphatase
MAATGKQMMSAPSPYGPIAPVLDGTTGLPLLALAEGFEYKSYGWTGDPMADGRPTPSNHDGMAVVRSERGDSQLLLVRNHERGLVAAQAQTLIAPSTYDSGFVNGIITVMFGTTPIRVGANGTVTDPSLPDPAPFVGYPGGGTTNLHFHGNQWVASEASIGGTLGNCAGGPTTWGSWLTCEETIVDFSGIGGKKHGYVYESAADPEASIATPIVSMGRFVHEAVALDPATGAVYETEDNRNLSALFRYQPHNTRGFVGSLQQGGTLQAARIAQIVKQARSSTLAQANDNALLNPDIGDEYVVEWVDIVDPDASPVVVTGQPGGVSFGFMAGPTYQALSNGCARMSRGEGIWYSAGRMFIIDTAAGTDASGRPGRGEGALWELDLLTMRLRAVFVSGHQAAGNNPDNVTVSPRGGVVLCEDGGFGVAGSRLLGLDASGAAYELCRNAVQLSADQIGAAGKTVNAGDYRGSEFAGACFDPKGHVLFASIQAPGITFAIKGPWKRGNL